MDPFGCWAQLPSSASARPRISTLFSSSRTLRLAPPISWDPTRATPSISPRGITSCLIQQLHRGHRHRQVYGATVSDDQNAFDAAQRGFGYHMPSKSGSFGLLAPSIEHPLHAIHGHRTLQALTRTAQTPQMRKLIVLTKMIADSSSKGLLRRAMNCSSIALVMFTIALLDSLSSVVDRTCQWYSLWSCPGLTDDHVVKTQERVRALSRRNRVLRPSRSLAMRNAVYTAVVRTGSPIKPLLKGRDPQSLHSEPDVA